MKNKLVFIIAGIVVNIGLLAVPVFADDAPTPTLFFRAINAGYKDDDSAQNYDFFELAKNVSDDLDLASYKVQYFNSSDKLANELEFPESTILHAGSIVLGFAKSPQFANMASRYLYYFGSAGLASTAGRLRIVQGETIIDEVCWGKLTCDNVLAKFATSQDDNKTALRLQDGDFIYEKYYPEINQDAFYVPEPEQTQSCAGLKITEIYAYYEDDPDEQFVELYNSLDQDIPLEACMLHYKNKDYALQGTLAPGRYIIVQELTLTKNPSTSVSLEIVDFDGVVDAASYAHGQKIGTSIALLDGQ